MKNPWVFHDVWTHFFWLKKKPRVASRLPNPTDVFPSNVAGCVAADIWAMGPPQRRVKFLWLGSHYYWETGELNQLCVPRILEKESRVCYIHEKAELVALVDEGWIGPDTCVEIYQKSIDILGSGLLYHIWNCYYPHIFGIIISETLPQYHQNRGWIRRDFGCSSSLRSSGSVTWRIVPQLLEWGWSVDWHLRTRLPKCIESLENQTWDLLDFMMMMMMMMMMPMNVFLVYIYITIELVIAGFLNHQEYFVRYLR